MHAAVAGGKGEVPNLVLCHLSFVLGVGRPLLFLCGLAALREPHSLSSRRLVVKEIGSRKAAKPQRKSKGQMTKDK